MTDKITHETDAQWIRRNLVALTTPGVYEEGAEGDQDLVDDFDLVIGEYARRRERASLARIRGRFVERGSLAARRETPERDVSLPWLHGS